MMPPVQVITHVYVSCQVPKDLSLWQALKMRLAGSRGTAERMARVTRQHVLEGAADNEPIIRATVEAILNERTGSIQ